MCKSLHTDASECNDVQICCLFATQLFRVYIAKMDLRAVVHLLIGLAAVAIVISIGLDLVVYGGITAPCCVAN